MYERKSKQGVWLILASLIITTIAAIPMIINLNDSFLVPSLIGGVILFLSGIFFLVKKA